MGPPKIFKEKAWSDSEPENCPSSNGALLLVKKKKKKLKPKSSADHQSPSDGKIHKISKESKKIKKKEDKNDIKKKKKLKKKVKENKNDESKPNQDEKEEEQDEDREMTAEQPATSSFANRLKNNLKGSRFRFINERLYTMSGSEAAEMFEYDKEAFQAYHDGYGHQVEQWPFNPLDRMIKAIRKMPKEMVIVDFGCGEGRLAKSVTQKVYSIDLVSCRDDIIACDMANTPLLDKCADVAVYCLSLMGTNLKDFFLEANRVLKKGGIVKIAEVSSRFNKFLLQKFIDCVGDCGFELVKKEFNNNLFHFMDFRKTKDVDKKSNRVPNFVLSPCYYKKR